MGFEETLAEWRKESKRKMGAYEIGGHIFHVNSWHDTKAEAQKRARWLREKGSLARTRKIRGRWATMTDA